MKRWFLRFRPRWARRAGSPSSGYRRHEESQPKVVSEVFRKENMRMKRIAMFLAIAAMCVGIGRAQDKTRTFHGDIMDSNCAAKGAHGMPDSKACTLACVKGGAKFVLYNSTTKKTYQLDDQAKPAD